MTKSRVIANKAFLYWSVGTALVTMALGAAPYLRGPDLASAPEIPATRVVLNDGRALHVQIREVTVSQWQACHRAGHCLLDIVSAEAEMDYPATGLNYPDAMEYISWVNSFAGPAWRLPTGSEWKELANEVMPEKADPLFADPSLTWASTYLIGATNTTGRALRPSGAFSTTSAGIEDLDGNVWEWTQDCYAGASGQGRDLDNSRCPAFLMGGEHEAVMAYLVRDPSRGGCAVGVPPAHLGIRLVSGGS